MMQHGMRIASAIVVSFIFLFALADSDPACAQCPANFVEHYGGEVSSVARSGTRSYAIIGDELFVYDGPGSGAQPTELGSLLIAGDHLCDLAASGDYAYIAARNSGLKVIDATDPASPFVTASLLLPTNPLFIAYSNNFVFLCDPYEGHPDVFIVDVSTPSSPSLAGTYSPGTAAADGIAVFGNTLYVATTSGVKIVNAANHATPSLITTYESATSFGDIDVSSGVMAVVRKPGGIADLVDVSNTAAPSMRSQVTASDSAIVRLNSSANRLYVGDGSVHVWGISNLDAPVSHAYFSTAPKDIATANARINIGTVAGTYEQWNTSDLENPVQEWQFTKSPPYMENMAANSNRLLFSKSNDLHILDTSVPGAAVELPSIHFSNAPDDVSITGSLAFVASGSRLSIVDLARPGGASVIGYALTIDSATAVVANDSYALVGEAGSIVEVFDVADPTNPTSLGSVDLDPVNPPGVGSVTKIVVEGSFACASTYDDSFIISLVNPSNPQMVYNFNVVDPPVDIAVSGGTLCLVNKDLLRVDLYDITSPPIPILVGNYDETVFTPTQIAADGNLLVAFDDSYQYSQIVYVDISNPLSPSAISHVPANPYCKGMAITPDRIWRRGGRDPSNRSVGTGLWELTRPGFDAISPPDDANVCAGHLATFSVTVSGSPTYQWMKDGLNISNGFTGHGSFVSGATTNTLNILSADTPDEGEYSCMVTNTCGTITTAPAMLNICTGCAANVGDIPGFVSAVLSNASDAASLCMYDTDENGVLDGRDVVGYTHVLIGN